MGAPPSGVDLNTSACCSFCCVHSVYSEIAFYSHEKYGKYALQSPAAVKSYCFFIQLFLCYVLRTASRVRMQSSPH